MTLTELANRYGTDKGTECMEKHGYSEIYGQIIPATGKFNLLEIGIWHGDSIRMWLDYNPEMTVYGLDTEPKTVNYIQTSKRFKLLIGNQNDMKALTPLVETAKQFRYIVDDGGHLCSDILKSFTILFPYLEPGGVYFIEDLHAPYANPKTIKNYMASVLKSYEITCNNKLMIIRK